MTETVNKIIFKFGGKRYELSGQAGADGIGSEEIKDGSIKAEDLADEVKEGLDELNNVSITDEEIEEIFYPSENNGSGDVDDEIDDDDSEDNDIDGDGDVDDEL